MTQISTKFRMTTLAVLFAFCTMMMASTGAMAAAKSASGQNSALLQSNVAGGVLSGVVAITNFVNQGGQLVAQGTFNGTFTSATGVVTQLSQAITAPVTNVSASCPILNLVLGPINLNILGLDISVPNPIVLNITAVPGAGNLLGNLLCAVANLLNGGSLSGILDTLVADLNQILAAL